MVVQFDRADLRPTLTPHSVQDMLERVELLFAPLAQQRGLDWRVTPCVVLVNSDPLLLQRMVCNLVANAILYTERGGVMLSCRVRRNGLLVQVWDTGPGIALDEQGAVLEGYFRGGAGMTGQSGLGLRLSIVRRWVAAPASSSLCRWHPTAGDRIGLPGRARDHPCRAGQRLSVKLAR